MENKLKLYGFNNLTKALSFNIYDVCYAKTEREQQKYIAYIDEQYNSDRLVKILTNVSQMIGAEVLNISKQDYDPQGASVTFLIAEEHMKPALEPDTIVVSCSVTSIKAMLQRTLTRNTTPKPASPRSAWTSTWRPAGRSRRFLLWII